MQINSHASSCWIHLVVHPIKPRLWDQRATLASELKYTANEMHNHLALGLPWEHLQQQPRWHAAASKGQTAAPATSGSSWQPSCHASVPAAKPGRSQRCLWCSEHSWEPSRQVARGINITRLSSHATVAARLVIGISHFPVGFPPLHHNS